jgi:hypothetical protein
MTNLEKQLNELLKDFSEIKDEEIRKNILILIKNLSKPKR